MGIKIREGKEPALIVDDSGVIVEKRATEVESVCIQTRILRVLGISE